MPTLTVDNTAVSFEPGETILQAATRAGFAIPTLCSLEGIEPPASCYVCVVKIQGKNGMAPSCATLAEAGMVVESGSEEVRRYRRRALELLLSEHAGDCEAPCRRICPADLDIPVMARHIAEGDLEGATRTVRERLALPGVLGHICPAPCEKGCLRARVDGAVSIRELHKGVADAEQASGAGGVFLAPPSTGKRVTVIGAGPAGLSSAYYLALLGHACTIVDEREEPGGMLRYGVDRAVLPLPVLDREIALIRSLGVEFRMGCRISGQPALDELLRRSDAVIFATGMPVPDRPWTFDVPASAKGIEVDSRTFESGGRGVFACGGAIAVCRLAVRAVGQGRLTAQSVHHFLAHASSEAGPVAVSGDTPVPPLGAGTRLSPAGSGDTPVPGWERGHVCPAARTGVSLLPVQPEDKSVLAPTLRLALSAAHSPRFDSRLDKPDDEELRQMAATDLASIHAGRVLGEPAPPGWPATSGRGRSCASLAEASRSAPFPATLVAAAARCMQCDCGKKLGCALRTYAQEYEINRDQYKTGARKRVTRTRYASGLVHEPGKCIDCGRCVGITAAEKIQPGLAFGNRGFDVTVKAPFNADMDTAMGHALERCVAACPVGALWDWRRTDSSTHG